MQLDEAASEGESDTEPTDCGTFSASPLRKQIKDPFQVIGADPFAGIGNVNDDIPFVLRHGKRNGAARRGVFRRVIEQVSEHLLQAREVAVESN